MENEQCFGCSFLEEQCQRIEDKWAEEKARSKKRKKKLRKLEKAFLKLIGG